MKKTTKIIFSVIAAVAAVAIAFGAVVALRYGDGHAAGSVMETASSGRQSERASNILFLGTDREAGLCDVMMLVNVNYTDGSVTVAQIPRDTYAAYTDKSYKKLNGAYNSLGGAEQTARFLEGAMGIRIDHYICIGLDTLVAVVDAVGGVDVELPCDMLYKDPEQGLYIDLKKGRQHLDGALAEKFIRFRAAYAQGDLGRIDAQKMFMAALFSKLAEDLSPALTLKLCKAAENVETDLGVADMLSIGVQALDMDKQRIRLLTLPGEELVATESGASYYVLSRAANEEIMERYFGRSADFDREEVFLNNDYKSFGDAYRKYTEYDAQSLEDITENGIKIQIK